LEDEIKLTEAKHPKYEIVIKEFEAEDIEFIRENDKIWISTTAIAKGLGLNRTNINQSFHRNKHLLESHSTDIILISDNRPRNTRVFDRTGFIYLCIRSNSPRALPFQEWVLNVIDEIMNKGFYIEKFEKGSMEWALQTVEVMKTVLLQQKKQEDRLKQLEEKDRYIFVIPRTKRILRNEVDRVAREYFNGKHYKIWNPLKTHYNVSRYEEFTEEDAQAILKGFAREYPPKTIPKTEVEEF